MKINKTPEGWDISVLGSTLNVTIVEDRYDRGGVLGETARYGSKVTHQGPYGNVSNRLTIVDKKHPSFKPSLRTILLEHSRQFKLGTFGEIDSPHEFNNRMFIETLSSLGEDIIDDRVSEYIQIPFVTDVNGSITQSWEVAHVSENITYIAYRRYEGSYYVTKIERELISFEHPLRDGVPDNNIIRRKEIIETTSLKASPLFLLNAIKTFG